MKEMVFISSVQKELEAERQSLRDFIRGDVLLGQYFDAFLFEDLPAGNQSPDQMYLSEVDRSGVYLGIFADQYGWEDAEGVSPTEREFNRATLRKKNRLVFVKGADDSKRSEKMRALIRKVERQLTRRRFVDIADLRGKVYASLIAHLESRGILPHRPLHAAACHGAKLTDINKSSLQSFLKLAQQERQLAINPNATVKDAMTGLNLLDDGKPTHAAILLFGSDPQRFLSAAEVACMHFHGTTVVKPIPSYKRFKGTLFEQVDSSIDFIMSKLVRAVGTRSQGSTVPVEYEIPRPVVAEAIVNAIAHRDYASAAATQIYLFADRFEVWNPGELPAGLTPDALRSQHPSLPRNPLIAESMFLAHYIEKVGTGTLDVIAGCQIAELPEPEFFQDGSQFVVRIWRDWLTESYLDSLGLSDRQRKAVIYVKQTGRISNSEFQEIGGVTRKTSARDLDALVDIGVFERHGEKRGTHYVLGRMK
jgi:ATP-dependent DNA helicase RecG